MLRLGPKKVPWLLPCTHGLLPGEASHKVTGTLKQSHGEACVEMNQLGSTTHKPNEWATSKWVLLPQSSFSMTAAPLDHRLQPHEKSQDGTTQTRCSWFPDQQNLWEMRNDYCCFQALSFGMICFAVICNCELLFLAKAEWAKLSPLHAERSPSINPFCLLHKCFP